MQRPMSARLSRGYSIAVAGAAILSTTAIFIRYLTQTYQIPALVLAFWRDIFVVLTLLPVLGLIRPVLLRISRGHFLYLAGYGLVLALFNSFWTLSVSLNGAAVLTVLVYCSAAFTAFLGWIFLQEQLTWVKILAIGICLGGCTLVSGALTSGSWSENLSGILTGIASGLFYAIYSLLGRSAAQRGLSPWTTLFYTFGFAALFLLLINLLPGRFIPGSARQLSDFLWLKDSAAGWGILFLLAAGPTVAGFGLYNVSLSYLPSSIANLIVTLEPAFTTVTAYIFLGERLSGIQIGGGLMIMGGVILLRMYDGWISARQLRIGT